MFVQFVLRMLLIAMTDIRFGFLTGMERLDKVVALIARLVTPHLVNGSHLVFDVLKKRVILDGQLPVVLFGGCAGGVGTNNLVVIVRETRLHSGLCVDNRKDAVAQHTTDYVLLL